METSAIVRPPAAYPIDELVEFYLRENRPVGIVLNRNVIAAQAMKAVRYFLGFADLTHLERAAEVGDEAMLTKSEWATILPLFELYIERENALILESSRALGVEVYGRTVAEVANDIQLKEQEIQNLAFSFEFFTV